MEIRFIVIRIVVSLILFFVPVLSNAQDEPDVIEIHRYPIDLEGVIQDISSNIVNGVTLHVWTEYPIDPWSGKMEEKYYCLKVDSSFHLQLTPGASSMEIAAEKEGYRGTSGYHFDDEELSAKDVVIRLLPYVRESELDSAHARVGIYKGESYAYSFKRNRKISLKWKPDPNDIYIALETIGSPVSFNDMDSYSVVLVGIGVGFCEGFPLPALKYAGQGFLGDLLQASENGYVSRIEVDDPKDLENRCFYFKTREGKYGKFGIEKGDIYTGENGVKVSFEYDCQPDGTRDLATKLSFVPPDTTPPTTTDNYQHNSVWTNQDANITLTATDDISGVAYTYYRVNSGTQQEGTNIIVAQEGQRTVSYWSVDTLGNTESPKTIGVWIDKTPPDVTISAEPSILWPPNNKPVQVTISGSAIDNLSGVVSTTFTVTDEYNEVTANLTDFGQKIELIAEREGSDMDGRVYTVQAVVTDKAGNSTNKQVSITVPHDMGKQTVKLSGLAGQITSGDEVFF